MLKVEDKNLLQLCYKSVYLTPKKYITTLPQIILGWQSGRADEDGRVRCGRRHRRRHRLLEVDFRPGKLE